MNTLNAKKAQSIVEYSICVGLVVIALFSMSVYVKRNLQGRYADVVDYSISGANASGMNVTNLSSQYEPYYYKVSVESIEEVKNNVTYNKTDISKKLYSGTRLYNLSQENGILESNVTLE